MVNRGANCYFEGFPKFAKFLHESVPDRGVVPRKIRFNQSNKVTLMLFAGLGQVLHVAEVVPGADAVNVVEDETTAVGCFLGWKSAPWLIRLDLAWNGGICDVVVVVKVSLCE